LRFSHSAHCEIRIQRGKIGRASRRDVTARFFEFRKYRVRANRSVR